MERIKFSALLPGAKHAVRQAAFGERTDTGHYRVMKDTNGKVFITRIGSDGRSEMWFQVVGGPFDAAKKTC